MNTLRYSKLAQYLGQYSALAVAFSGGVDSTLLLKAAYDALGDRALAITIDGPMHHRRELDEARQLATIIGVRQTVLKLGWDDLPGLEDNPLDRCYRCKQAIITCCRRYLATVPGTWPLVEGSTTDDLKAHRPGRRALAELQVGSPLQACGWSKEMVRSASRELGLPTADKPAQSCLLTRFPHDMSLTVADLRRVETCEEQLHDLGYRLLRVRSIGDTARLEFAVDELATAQRPDRTEQIVSLCRQAGFTTVTIDPAGYCSGSMDQN